MMWLASAVQGADIDGCTAKRQSYFPMRRRIPLSKQLLLFVLRIASK